MLVLPSLILVKLFIQEPFCFRMKSFASCLFKNPRVSVRNPGQVTQDFVRKHKGSWIYNLQRISYENNRLDFTFKLPRISYGNSRFSSKILFPYEIQVKLPWISYGNSILIFKCYFRTKSIPPVICWDITSYLPLLIFLPIPISFAYSQDYYGRIHFYLYRI